jgi:glycosyltransferase involved in cell wall biosynthesis
MKISVILPAYNEEKTIGDIIKIIKEFREKENLDLEIIVVSDGSKDKTVEIAKKEGADLVIESKINKGKGEAVLTGFKYSKGEKILLLDADLINLKLEHLYSLYNASFDENVGMVVGMLKKNFLPQIFSGQRIVKRDILEILNRRFENKELQFKKIGFKLEGLLDSINMELGYKVNFVELKDLNHLKKETKYGFLKGIFKRLKMIGDILKFIFVEKVYLFRIVIFIISLIKTKTLDK